VRNLEPSAISFSIRPSFAASPTPRARASRPDPEFSLTPTRLESIQDDTTNVPDAKIAAHIETNAAKEGAYARATQGLFCWFFI